MVSKKFIVIARLLKSSILVQNATENHTLKQEPTSFSNVTFQVLQTGSLLQFFAPLAACQLLPRDARFTRMIQNAYFTATNSERASYRPKHNETLCAQDYGP